MNDIRKYVQLIESQQPSIITASDDDNHYLFTYDAERLYESSGISWQLLLENRIQWLRDNIMHKLKPVADQEGKTTEELFNWIIEQDPSKKKQYSQWLMKILVGKNAQSTINDLKNAKEVLSRYEELKNSKKLKPEHKDLNRFKSISELKSAIYETEDGIDKEREAIDRKARSESDILHEDDTWIIVIPKSEYAAGYWGMNSMWCTATGFDGSRQESRIENEFNDYNKKGNLYIFYNKNDSSDIYQLSIPAKQFMDSENNSIGYPKTKKLLEITDVIDPLISKELAKTTGSPDPQKVSEVALEIFGYPYKSIELKEEYFLESPKDAFWYANKVKRGEFKKGEPVIAQDKKLSLQYAKHVLRGRFEEAEKVHSNDPEFLFKYSKNIIGGRFEEAEDTIGRDAIYSVRYATDIISGRFGKGEASIAKSAYHSVEYAQNVVKGRFEKGEDAIAQDAYFSLQYAKDVIGGRFEKGEKIMRENLDDFEKERYYDLTGIEL